MIRKSLAVGSLLLFNAALANAQQKKQVLKPIPIRADSMSSIFKTNPVIAEWEGPYGGVPAFDKIKLTDFKPAVDAAIAQNLAEINRITLERSVPSFDNTIAALERSGRAMSRFYAIYGIWSSNLNSPEFQPIQAEIEPMLAALQDKIIQNTELFRRVEAIYYSGKKNNLTPEQQRLTWRYYTNFVHAGAKIDEKTKAEVAEINQQLATLYNHFNQNLLADEGEQFLEIKNESDLAGLPPSFKDAAAAEATRRKLPGSWVISNTRSSIDPFLTYCDNRMLREKAWLMFINRGDNGDAHDNNSTITQILQLRAKRAKLFGFATHAHWRLDNVMAKTPEHAMELMEAVWKPAVARVHEEVTDMQAIADKEGAGITIEPWDYRYYAEKVRKSRYDLNQDEVKSYLQLDKMKEAMFWVAGELFGLRFTPLNGIPVYHPDVSVYKVTDKTSGKLIGLWYFDPYARQGKRSGAWMNAYRNQERFFKDITTIVSNNSNFIKGQPGEPILISWDDATTLFHEFGHALHGLSSNVKYPLLSGTNVARDYVEFPSQIMERWLSTPEVLQRFALHFKTGQPIPQSLVDKIHKAATFNQGFKTVEYMASALVDMKLHLAGDQKIDPDAFEKETLAAYGMPKEIVMRHRTPQFAHIFSSDEYSAGYYSYIWADVISADAYEAFTEAGGPYDKKIAKSLFDKVLSVGGSVDEGEAYKSFRGRDPKIDALMKHRGFPVQQKK